MNDIYVSFPHIEPVAFLRGFWMEEPSALWQSEARHLAPFPNYAEISELTTSCLKRGANPVRLQVVCPSAVWKVSCFATRDGGPRRYHYEAYRASDPWRLKLTDSEYTIYSSEVRMLSRMQSQRIGSPPNGLELGDDLHESLTIKS